MISRLIAECTDYDFKLDVEYRKTRSWLKSVSAFANTIGGTIFFGVDNDKNIIGMENISDACDFISESIKAKINPTPLIYLDPIEEDGKKVIILKVYAGVSTPYYYESDGKKKAYIRLGNESLPAPNHILNELILKGLNLTYDTIVTNYKKKDYSFTFFEATYFDTTKNKITDLDYLSFNLVNNEGYLTNAGVLLADQDIYRHSRTFCTRWNGLDKSSINNEAIDDKEISGGLIKQLLSSMDFVKNNTKKMWFKEGRHRKEKPEYDEIAVREAIVNGLIHREYTRLGSEVSIDIFDDRLEVTSPGKMFSGKSIDFNINQAIPSERRNPVLADIFARMKFMERRGSGLKKIYEKTNKLFNDNENHTIFYSDTNFFKVIIFNANYKNVTKLEQNVTVAEENVTVAEENVAVAEQNVTKLDKNVTIAEQNVTVAEQNVTVAEENVAVAEQNVTKLDKNVTVAEQNVTVAEENVTVAEENVTVAEQNVTVAEENVTVAEENVTIAGKNVTIQLNKTEITLCKIIKKNKVNSYDDFIPLIKKNKRTIIRNIKSLMNKGIIKRVGTNRKGYWEVIEEEK